MNTSSILQAIIVIMIVISSCSVTYNSTELVDKGNESLPFVYETSIKNFIISTF